jgi:glycosyltransferase involved in cell wall biosynthesis
MRVLVYNTSVFPVCEPSGTHGYAGLEVIAWHCAKGLAQKGHEVSMVCSDGSTCDGVKIIPTGPAGTWDEQKNFDAVWKQLKDFDVCIDHSWQKHSYLLKAEGVYKYPVLGVLHAPVNTMYQSLPPGVEKPCFVCISEDQRNHFEALFNHPARTAYNGVDEQIYQPLNIPRSDRVLFLGRFSTIKGPSLAIESCLKAGLGLDLIGDTSITNEPEYFQQCKSMCDGKQIKMVGPANRGNCVWWHSQSLLLIHPVKIFREPFGLSPVESMMCGSPVIAWNNGAMRETVRGKGETGWLVHSFDELVNVLRNVQVSDAMRKRCREWTVENFRLEKMINRYEVLCQEAIEGGW